MDEYNAPIIFVYAQWGLINVIYEKEIFYYSDKQVESITHFSKQIYEKFAGSRDILLLWNFSLSWNGYFSWKLQYGVQKIQIILRRK